MHIESIQEHDLHEWQAATAENVPQRRPLEPIVNHASKIRRVFYRATNLEALKYTHRLLGWFADFYGDNPNGRMWYTNLSADYNRAKRELETSPSNPYLWGRDLRSRFENR